MRLKTIIFIEGEILSLFRDYSSSGPKGHAGSKPYQYVYRTEYGSYAFNGIDLNPDPGPKRPFNFFGHVDPVGIPNGLCKYVTSEVQASGVIIVYFIATLLLRMVQNYRTTLIRQFQC